MSKAEKLKNPFVQQYLIELVFPLLGYFLFGWTIWIIGLFYLIDHLVDQGLFFRRASRVAKYQKKPNTVSRLLGYILIFGVLFGVEILLLVYGLNASPLYTVELLQTEFVTFAREELWILFPVIILAYYWKDQVTFYMPRRFIQFDFEPYLKMNFLSNLTIVLLLAIVGTLWLFLFPNELIALFGFLLVKILFDLTVKKRFVQRTKLQ